MTCGVCRHEATTVMHLSGGLSRCRGCGVLTTGEPPTTTFDADYYTRNYEDVDRDAAYRAVIDRVNDRTPPPARVLDVGCGSGRLLALLRERGYEVAGVDSSPAARAAAADLDLSVAAELDALPKASFDAVLMIDVIAHVPNIGTLAHEAVARLRGGGTLVVKTPTVTSTVVVLDAALRSGLHTRRSPLLHTSSRVHFFDAAALRRSMRHWDLRDIRVDRVGEPRVRGRRYGALETAAQLLQARLTRGGALVGLGTK